MQRERVTDDIYVFTSDLYAQVTAGVIVTDVGVVVIDTLVYPEETLQMKRFIEERLERDVRYVVNTHFHADHTTGTCFFDNAEVIAHTKCRELLNERGRDSLEKARTASPDMQNVRLVLPSILFDHSLTLHLGNKTLHFRSTPGHSPDSIICFVEEDQVLFAADTLMPIPYFVDGSYDDFLASLNLLQAGNYEHIIQGHGEVILKGEIEEKINNDIEYMLKLSNHVDYALAHDKRLNTISIESCGKSRILLNGTAQQLHFQNVNKLADLRRNPLAISVGDQRYSTEE